MEYLHYILVILGIMALFLLLMRMPGQKRLKHDKAALSERAKAHRADQKPSRAELRKKEKHDREVIEREKSKVPVPWGWPGHDE